MKVTDYKHCYWKSLCCCFICFACMLHPAYAANVQGTDVNAGHEQPPEPEIAGESGIVMEASTGVVLFEKNMHDVHYPASITKIMTALLAIENCKMDEIVTVPPEAVYMEDKGTHIALDEGEQLTVEQCLYAVMLASANDAAYALAAHVGGTAEHFISMMNDRAKELGCLNTNFTNPHGLPDEQHLTSAYDMALITRAALEYDWFRRVSGTSYYEIPPSEHQKDLICMYNHHKMIAKSEFYDERVFAGKNGYTEAARHTLVTCAGRDDLDIICVIMKAEGTQDYEDTAKLLEYGLENFSKTSIDKMKEDHQKMPEQEKTTAETQESEELDQERTAAQMQESEELDQERTAAQMQESQEDRQEKLSKEEQTEESQESKTPPEQRKKDDYLRYILFGGIIAAAAAGCLLLKQKYQNRD